MMIEFSFFVDRNCLNDDVLFDDLSVLLFIFNFFDINFSFEELPFKKEKYISI